MPLGLDDLILDEIDGYSGQSTLSQSTDEVRSLSGRPPVSKAMSPRPPPLLDCQLLPFEKLVHSHSQAALIISRALTDSTRVVGPPVLNVDHFVLSLQPITYATEGSQPILLWGRS